jgi:hypothetical protein
MPGRDATARRQEEERVRQETVGSAEDVVEAVSGTIGDLLDRREEAAHSAALSAGLQLVEHHRLEGGVDVEVAGDPHVGDEAVEDLELGVGHTPNELQVLAVPATRHRREWRRYEMDGGTGEGSEGSDTARDAGNDVRSTSKETGVGWMRRRLTYVI